MRRILRQSLALWLLLGSLFPVRADFFRNLNLDNGLSQFSVMSIGQDSLGRMWFGTYEGINVYDGHRIRYYKGWVENTPGKRMWLGNMVNNVCCGGDGNIYFLADKNLFLYDIRKECFRQLTTGNLTSALAADRQSVWYARRDSLLQWDCQTRESRYVRQIPAGVVHTLAVTRSGSIYIGSDNGLFVAETPCVPKLEHLLAGKQIHSIYESSRHGIWIGSYVDGLHRIYQGKLDKVPESSYGDGGPGDRQIRQFTEDRQHNIWFGTFSGLRKFDSVTGKFSTVQIPQHMGGLSHPSIFALFTDRQGVVWVGSYYGGVSYFTPRKEDYLHYNYQEHTRPGLYYSYLGEMLHDRHRNLWFCTDGGGVICVDSLWRLRQQLTAAPGGLPHNNVKSLVYDKENDRLYIATYLGGLSRYDLRTREFHNYLHRTDGPGNIIYHLKLWNGKLYLTSRKGLYSLDLSTDTFRFLTGRGAFRENFDIDPQGNIYLMGWDYVEIVPPGEETASRVIPMRPYGCQGTLNRVVAADGGVYICTMGSGLYFYDTSDGRMEQYTQANSQLPSDYCYQTVSVGKDSLAVSTDKGVSLFTPGNRQAVTLVFSSEMPVIHGGGLYLSPEREVYVGGTKGITVLPLAGFQPARGKDLPFYFSNLWINDRLVTPQTDSTLLAQALPFTRKISLKPHQNNCVVAFTYPNHKDRVHQQRFEYKLEGFNSQWVPASGYEIHYTNLDPGDYTLRLRLADVPEKEATLDIHIATPWYLTSWAWLLFLAAAVAGTAWFVRNRWAKRSLALSLDKERFEKQQIEETNRAKQVFFTNVSHELRTPLTLIVSHLDALLQEQLPVQLYNKLLKVKQNAQYMTNLVTKLLDFQKFSQHQMALQLVHQDICRTLQEIYLTFADYARRRDIGYTFEAQPESISCWMDRSQMEKVFFNLLSNAFKYTPDGGNIRIKVSLRPDSVMVETTDSGSGISESEQPHVFDRFFQGKDQHGQERAPGTGIGLALAKSIVEAHHGTIAVSSVVRQGSTFTVTLPLEKEAFRDDPHVQFSESVPPADGKKYSPPVAEPERPAIPLPEENPLLRQETDRGSRETAGKKKYTLLLVEDNLELLQALKQIFGPFYHILTATNGKEGLAAALENKPDIVISDIMMPEMNGTEMCLKIKNNIDLCHIPVVLLTALNSVEQNIEGLNRGADDYITKPFDAQILLARTNNLVRNRLLVQHQLKRQPISEVDLTSINPLDQELLQKVDKVIEAHIDDVEFDIPRLCREVGMGRSLLYSKFKALTGMTPNNFLLNYRLKFAATLLNKYPTLPIAEVSDRSGFSSPLYFSRCFKSQYGETPQNYRRKQQGQADS